MLAKLKAAVPLGAVRAIYRLQAKALPPDPQTFQLISRYCRGAGLEIGPGTHPYCDPRTTTYLEKHPESRDGYPSPHIVADANDIPSPDDRFDYVLSSHVLEHMPDTIQTLKEWGRVLKPGGVLFLILPHGERTFDRHRELTKLDHHVRDHQHLNGGADHSHDDEAREGWRQLNDLAAITAAHHATFGDGTMWDFAHRIEHDAMHYHVWTQDEIVRLLQFLGWRIAAVAEQVSDRSDSFVVVARKS